MNESQLINIDNNVFCKNCKYYYNDEHWITFEKYVDRCEYMMHLKMIQGVCHYNIVKTVVYIDPVTGDVEFGIKYNRCRDLNRDLNCPHFEQYPSYIQRFKENISRDFNKLKLFIKRIKELI